MNLSEGLALAWLAEHALSVGLVDGYAYAVWPWTPRTGGIRYLWSRRGSFVDVARAAQEQERLYREGL